MVSVETSGGEVVYKTLCWWDELPIAKFSLGSMYWAFWSLKLSVIWVVGNKGKKHSQNDEGDKMVESIL
jgi:hypothetical protein